jgi:hypothetical protein
MRSEVVCLPSRQLDALYERDLGALWQSEPIGGDASHRVFVRLRSLEAIERLAWGVNDDRAALGFIAEESESGGSLNRALLRRPSGGPVTLAAHDAFAEIEASERLPFPDVSLLVNWQDQDTGGAA